MTGLQKIYQLMLFPGFPSTAIGIVRVILADVREAAIADKEPLLRYIVLNAVEDRCREGTAIALLHPLYSHRCHLVISLTAAYAMTDASGRAKIIRPAEVCSAPVTTTVTASPIKAPPSSTTTIVPSFK